MITGVAAPTVQRLGTRKFPKSEIVRMGHMQRTNLPSGINNSNFTLLGKHHTLSHFDPKDHSKIKSTAMLVDLKISLESSLSTLAYVLFCESLA